MYFYLAVFCTLVPFVVSNPLIPCKLTDANCLDKTGDYAYSKFIDGNPEFGTEKLDPMHHDVIKGDLSGLKYTFTNTTVVGFKNCKIENIKLASLTSLHVVLLCPKLAMSGKYDMKGRLIVLPIEGNGDYSITTGKYQITVDADFKIVTGKDGKTYMSVKHFKHTSEPMESIKFDFKNLFNGQKDLADATTKFANENWYDVAKELAKPVMKSNLKLVIKNANQYLKTISIEDLISS